MSDLIQTKCDDIEQQMNGVIDISKLKPFNDKIKELHKCTSPMHAPIYMRDFIIAFDICNTFLMKAIKIHGEAEANLKMAESIAYLDRAGDQLRMRGMKDSAESRKKYVPIDPGVVRATEVKNKSEALLAFLKNKLIEYKTCHDDVKKASYSNNLESDYEGMR